MKRLIISHYILTAVSAAALLFASSCTHEPVQTDEEIIQEGVYEVVLTATIADNDPATRGVTVSPEAITSTWSPNDLVALVYNGEVISQLTVSSISGNSAQLTGKVWGAYPTGTPMSLYYGGTNYDYSGQNGTKASAEARAYLKADIVTVTQANKILTLGAVELKHQQAYFELSFRNGPDQLKIQSVEVTGTEHIIKSKTIGANGGTAYYSNTSEGEHFTITAEGSEGLSTVYFVISDDGEYPTAPTYSFKVTAVGISEPFTKEYKLDANNDVITPDLAKSLKIENGTYHSGEWILDQQTLSYTAPVSQSVVYDGESHELVTPGEVTYNSGEAEGAVMEYFVATPQAWNANLTTDEVLALAPTDNSTWSADVPTATEPGKYYVWFRVQGGVNFSDVDPAQVSGNPAFIDKRTLDVIFPVGVANLTYTGSAQALVTPGSLKDQLSEEFNPGLEIQYFSAYVTPEGNTDPDWPEATADGWSTEIPYGLHAGKYYVWYKVDGGAHYKDVVPYRVVLPSPSTLHYIPIAQTDAVIANAVPIEGLVYNGADQQLVLPADASDGCEVTYFVTENATLVPAADATGWTTEIAKAKNAGTYYTWVKVVDKTGGDNVSYTGFTDTGVSAAAVVTTIAKAPITVTVPAQIANWTYDGEEHTLLAASPVTAVTYKDKDNQDASAIASTENPNAAELYYMVNGVATKFTPETPNLPKAANAGSYAISYRVDGGRNFESKSATSIGTVTVSKVTPTVTVPVAVTGLAVNGSDQDLLESEGSTNYGTLQYALSTTNSAPTSGWSTNHPTGNAAGTYYVFYRVVGDDNINNVGPAAATNSPVTISKTDPTITAPAALALTYSGAAQNLVSPGTSEHGTFTYSTTENGTYSETIPQGTNAGSYTVWYKFTGDAGHNDIGATQVTGVKIDQYVVTDWTITPTSMTLMKGEQATVSVNFYGTGVGSTAPSVSDQSSGAFSYSHDKLTLTNTTPSNPGAQLVTALTVSTSTISVTLGSYSTSNYTFDGNRICEVTVIDCPTGAIPAKFSVSATEKVIFSQGNLQATGTTTSTPTSGWTWAFAEHQYDYIGSAAANNAINGNGSVSTDGTVDLFGWSTGATTNYYGINNSADNSVYSGDFVDWGTTMGSGWRTLTNAEWDYLMNSRSMTIRYAKATVHGKTGIILLPDNWSTDYYPNLQASGSFTSNDISDDNWSIQFEAHGAVFLPCAGGRNGTTVDTPSASGYWTSTLNSDTHASFLRLYDSQDIGFASTSRASGYSVRLVMNLPKQGSAGVSNYNVNNPQNW